MKIFEVQGFWSGDEYHNTVEVLMTDFDGELPPALDEQIMFQGILEEELKLSMDEGIPIVDDFIVTDYSFYIEPDPID